MLGFASNLGFRVSNFAALSGGGDIGTAGRSLFDFSGLQTTHTNIDAAHRSVQKEDLHFLEVRVEAATRHAGDFLTDAAGFFSETAAHDRIAR